jgi:tellurite resistance protein TehA-like permease
MACFTVATGFLLIGNHFLNADLSLSCAQVLWLVGVAGSIFSALVVPYLMFTRHDLTTESAYGSWLLPIVPPIVASVPGALLATHWPVALRSDMLALTYALWGTGMALATIIIVLFYSRLVYHKIPAGPLVPTLWLVVGPLGQSVAGVNALGNAASTIWPTLGPVLRAAAVVYGLPVWGFGVYWLILALAVTVCAAFKHLPFNLGWWAFTFPVGVLTAGTYALYTRTQTPLFAGIGVALLCLLALMWTLVATRSLYHLGLAIKRGFTVKISQTESLDLSRS